MKWTSEDERLVASACHDAPVLSVMSHPLDGCWAKVDRANVHLRFLDERVQAFVDGGSEAVRQPPMEEWGAIIGDVVHNLRSALDHLVWQLTIDNGHTPPPIVPPRLDDPGGQWRLVGFPIYVNPYPLRRGVLIPWDTAKEPQSLWGIRTRVRADLQGLQPFTHGKNAPREPLAVLNELWNIDKHRHLALTSFTYGLRDVRSRRGMVGFRILHKRDAGPFKGRAEIGRVEQVGPSYSPTPEMHVSTAVQFDIAFEQGAPAYGGRVVKILNALSATVARILVKFDSEFP